VIGRLWPRLRMVVGLAILGALVMRLGTGAFVEGLRAIDPGVVLAALGIGLLTTACSAGRWCLVARALGVRLAMPVAVADTYQALLLNSVLPAGVLGDVHRAVQRGARAVVLERVAGQLVVLIVGVGVLLAQPALLALVLGGLVPDVGAGAAAAGCLLAALAAVSALCAPRIRAAIRSGVADVRRGVFSRRVLPGVVLLSVAGLAGNVALFVVAARAAGSEAELGTLLPLVVLALLAMALPLNVGGWGPREAVTAVAFGAAGFGAAQGLAAAVVYGVLSLIACLPGAAVLLMRRTGRSPAPHALKDAPVTASVAPC
jgi:glycosyltransferase 2 family protein